MSNSYALHFSSTIPKVDNNLVLPRKQRSMSVNKDQSTYDYVKLYIGYFSNRFPVWEGIFTLNFF